MGILTELACEVTSYSAKRKNRRAREKVVEGLFLHGIDGKTARLTVGSEDHALGCGFSNSAKAMLPWAQSAVARAKRTADASVRK